jgi:hypothetical protein
VSCTVAEQLAQDIPVTSRCVVRVVMVVLSTGSSFREFATWKSGFSYGVNFRFQSDLSHTPFVPRHGRTVT